MAFHTYRGLIFGFHRGHTRVSVETHNDRRFEAVLVIIAYDEPSLLFTADEIEAHRRIRGRSQSCSVVAACRGDGELRIPFGLEPPGDGDSGEALADWVYAS